MIRSPNKFLFAISVVIQLCKSHSMEDAALDGILRFRAKGSDLANTTLAYQPHETSLISVTSRSKNNHEN